MGKYTGELKGPPRTVRFTDTEIEQINTFRGDSFNEKLSNLIAFASGQGLEEIESITEEINMLYAQRQKLMENIHELELGKQKVESSLDKLREIGERYNNEMFQKERRISEIKRAIRQEGFRAGRNVVDKIIQLDTLMEKKHSLKDICRIYKEREYLSFPDAQKLADKIGCEFKGQESSWMPEPID